MNAPHSFPTGGQSKPPDSLPSSAVILFDGVCNLCNGFVNFVVDHDPEGYFTVGSLQSETAKAYLEEFEADPNTLDTIVLIENGQLYTRSTAALRIFRHLTAPWPLLYVLVVVPGGLRDWLYHVIAGKRYDWFGRRDQCRRPTRDVYDRFIE